MNIYLTLLTVYLLTLASLNRERGRNAQLYELLPGRLFPRERVMQFAVYALVVTLLAMVMIPSRFDEAKVTLSVLFFAVLLAPLHIHHPSLTFYYTNEQAEMFRESLEKKAKNPANGELTNASHQTTMMPLYRDTAHTQRIGRFFSTAEMLANRTDKIHHIFQYITYVFDGTDPAFPKGTVVMAISMANQVHNIFPPDHIYRGHILTGSGAFAGATGVVDVQVVGSERKAMLRL